jgi:hypothetical protein
VLVAARHYAGLVGQVPSRDHFSPWLRPLARRVSAWVLYLARVFLTPQKLYQEAILEALAPLTDGLCRLQRDLLASRREVEQLRRRLDEMERQRRTAA